MRFSALRVRFLALTVLFALLLVATVSLMSYLVVTEAMMGVAESAMFNLASVASQTMRESVHDAQLAAASRGLDGEDLDRTAFRDVVDGLPETFRAGPVAVGEFALYDGDLELVWATGPDALNVHDRHREEATEHERAIRSDSVRVQWLSGLFFPADMGEYVVHVPIDLPGEGKGVLDVTYLPTREEATIDRIRPWMSILSLAATLIAVLLMQLSTGWVLGLVGDLRRAAESVDADRLDVRLPDLGRHEIGDLARSLNALIGRLRRRSEAQARFIADASHELATPVAGIRGYVNILREWGGEDPALRDEAIKAIDRESSRMARLCSDLLSLIRRERFSDRCIIPVDLNALVREVLASAATRYLEKGLEFVGPEESPLAIDGDPDRITQMVGVLVDNAGKYTESGGTVSVRTWQRLESVFIEVADTGVGIPEKDLPHIFDRFYRSDESRSAATGGFGIGLSIVKRLIDLSGGNIDVYSVEGVGTTFTVRLPKKAPAQEER